MQKFISAVLIAVAISCVSAQRISGGGCPNVQVKQDFDASKYVGVWYEIEKNPALFEAGMKCIIANYTAQKDSIRVVNSGISTLTGKTASIIGTATVPDKSVPAKLKVKFDTMPFTSDYWVLDTDYNEYSVVYSCLSTFNLFKAEFIWILSRDPAIHEETKTKIYKVLDDNQVSRKALSVTTQDC